MSAWPEAVYIIKQISKLLNLDKRVLKLQNKLYVFAKQTTKEGAIVPDLEEEYDFSNDSVWFVQKTDNPDKIFAVSVFSETLGWSSFIYLSPNVGEIDFTPTTQTGVLANVNNVDDAIKALASAVDNVQISDATKSSKGIVQVGDNINVSAGTISVPLGSASTAGVVKLYNNATGSNTDGTMTQAAIKAAIGQNAASSENAIIPLSGWSSTTVSLSGSDRGYYTNTINLTTTYGDHPTISLVATSPFEVPTREEIEAFNNIKFVMVNGNTCTLYAKFIPDGNLTINVKI